MLDLEIGRSKHPQVPFGRVHRLIVAHLRVIGGDLPIVFPVRDEERDADLFDLAVQRDLVSVCE